MAAAVALTAGVGDQAEVSRLSYREHHSSQAGGTLEQLDVAVVNETYFNGFLYELH